MCMPLSNKNNSVNTYLYMYMTLSNKNNSVKLFINHNVTVPTTILYCQYRNNYIHENNCVKILFRTKYMQPI